MYAKDKEERLVEPVNNSTVNKLHSLIPDKPIQFKKVLGSVDVKVLMKRRQVPDNPSIIEKFEELTKKKRIWNSQNRDRKNSGYYFDQLAKEELKALHNKEDYIADVLIYYLYEVKATRSKDMLWDMYGHIIVENIENNLKGTKVCEDCIKRFKSKQENEVLCKDCKKTRKQEQDRIANEKRRNARKAQPTEC